MTSNAKSQLYSIIGSLISFELNDSNGATKNTFFY